MRATSAAAGDLAARELPPLPGLLPRPLRENTQAFGS